MAQFGKLLVGLGLIIVLVGLVIWLFGDKLSWIGRLPGDIRIEQPGFSFYLPLTSMLLASAIASGVMWIVGKLFS